MVKFVSVSVPVVTWKTLADEVKEDVMVSVTVDVTSSSFFI